MKKLTSFLVALFFATTAIYAYNFQVGDLYYNITSSTAPYTVEVTYQQAWSSDNYKGLTTVTIPASVTYNGTTYAVTSIGDRAFLQCNNITSVTIPNTVTSIGNSAFQSCTNLTSISIPNTVTIGEGAFDNTAWYNSQPDGVVYINNMLYNYKGTMPAGTTIVVQEGTVSIPNNAFYDCTGLTSITIPSSITSIGQYAFYGCTGLNSVTWNAKNCTGWENDYDSPFFYVRNNITSFTIDTEVESIPTNLCNGMKNLTSVTWNAKKCGGWTGRVSSPFYDAHNNITSFTFGNEVDSIPAFLCYQMRNLTSITIPNSVTSIGNSAFSYCEGLTSVTIGNNVASIGNNVFSDCTGITSVTWNAKKCGGWGNRNYTKSPFYFISNNITSFTFGNEVDSIPAFLCYGMSNLSSITIPNSVRFIGTDAFCACTGLTSITIPSSVISIESSSFEACTGLTSIVVENANTVYDSRQNCNAIIESATNTLIYGCKATIIPNTITSIGNYAFWNCTGLSSITIPNSVTSIENGAFRGCEGLTTISIPNSVTNIGWMAFYYCTSLTAISIPNSVTTIGHSAFASCYSLTSIVVENGNTVYDSRENCNAIIETATNTLMQGCNTTVIPNSVTSIGMYAFSGCTGLTSITIPNSVTRIGDRAFMSCNGLTSITVLATTPPTIEADADAFLYVPTDIPVYIPCGTTDAYQAAANWSRFTNFIEIISYNLLITSQDEAMGTAQITKEATTCDDNTAVIEATANDGYQFTQWSDGNTDNPRTITVDEDITLTAQFVSTTAINNTFVNTDTTPQKVLHGGQVLILRGGKTYTVTGVQVEE